MKNLGKLLYTNKDNFKVYAVVIGEVSSQRLSIDLYMMSPAGEMSDLITVTRRDIFSRSKDWSIVLKEWNGHFGEDEVAKIKFLVEEMSKQKENIVTVQKKATMAELHQTISDYIRKNDVKENTSKHGSIPEIFTKEKFGYIKTTSINKFFQEHNELGFSRLDFLKRLKIMGALHPATDRPYDTLVSYNNIKAHYYKFELAPEVAEKITEEIVDSFEVKEGKVA